MNDIDQKKLDILYENIVKRLYHVFIKRHHKTLYGGYE
jgi:hypothetical protein